MEKKMLMKGNRSYTGDAGKISDHGQSNLFLKTDTEGDMIRGAGNLFQYFTIRTENAPLLRRRPSVAVGIEITDG